MTDVIRSNEKEPEAILEGKPKAEYEVIPITLINHPNKTNL